MGRRKNQAAKLGANGIVLIGVGGSGRSPVGLSVGGGIGIGIPTQQKQGAGVAIYVPPGAENWINEGPQAQPPRTQ